MPVRKFGVAATVMGDHAAFIQQFLFIVAATVSAGQVTKCLSPRVMVFIIAALVGPGQGQCCYSRKKVMGSQEFWAWRVDIGHSLFWA
jgi:hypothetical protein